MRKKYKIKEKAESYSEMLLLKSNLIKVLFKLKTPLNDFVLFILGTNNFVCRKGCSVNIIYYSASNGRNGNNTTLTN